MADSYTQALGIRAASALLVGTVLGAAGAAVGLLSLLGGGMGIMSIVTVAAAVGLAARAVMRFHHSPTPDSARRSEAAVGLAAITTHLVVVATLLFAHGVRVA
jgi:hypothetical protein